MKENKHIIKIPWDSAVFGMDAYEITSVSERILKLITRMKGHFTVKVNPLSPKKKLLQQYGFYYCDTLIQPYCPKESFRYFNLEKGEISLSNKITLKELLAISHGAFSFDRFHRDFNINKKFADMRYDIWVSKLYKSNHVVALFYNGNCIGFFAHIRNKLRLSAISKEYRGKGLAKFVWSAACKALFDKGYQEIISSISVSNCAIFNLHILLGFKIRNPVDVYHKLIT